jgi:gluconolactonase
MMRPAPIVASALFTRLPEALHHKGEPSPWARMTRPGQPMHSFIEGAFFDGDGALWLTDVPYGRIFRIDPDSGWHLAHHYDGEPHAMRFAPDGRPIVVDCRHGLLELTGRDSTRLLSGGLPDQPFLGLSDMAFAPDGTLWFTDSGRTSLSDPRGRVYRRSAAGELRLVLDNIPYANGIALSPDGAHVYLAATRANEVWRFSADLPEAGAPMTGTFLHLSGGLGPDGLCVNGEGWLAVAQAQAGRAYVFDALGDPLAEVRLPEGLWTTSVAFHPDDQRRLTITDAQLGGVHVADLSTLGAAT